MAGQLATVKYAHEYAAAKTGIYVARNASSSEAINAKYLLCLIDRMNAQSGASTATSYCNHSLATTQAADVDSVHDAVKRLFNCNASGYYKSGSACTISTASAVGPSVMMTPNNVASLIGSDSRGKWALVASYMNNSANHNNTCTKSLQGGVQPLPAGLYKFDTSNPEYGCGSVVFAADKTLYYAFIDCVYQDTARIHISYASSWNFAGGDNWCNFHNKDSNTIGCLEGRTGDSNPSLDKLDHGSIDWPAGNGAGAASCNGVASRPAAVWRYVP